MVSRLTALREKTVKTVDKAHARTRVVGAGPLAQRVSTCTARNKLVRELSARAISCRQGVRNARSCRTIR
ncbi:hypothetical protein PT2222_90127 [Paraburkholderia tropica]